MLQFPKLCFNIYNDASCNQRVSERNKLGSNFIYYCLDNGLQSCAYLKIKYYRITNMNLRKILQTAKYTLFNIFELCFLAV